MICHRLHGITISLDVELRTGVNTLGRNPANTIEIQDASISGFHCEITVDESEVWVRDLESTNGTFIDGAPVGRASLRCGQTLQVGSLEFLLVDQEYQISVPKPAPTRAEASPPPAALPNGAKACFREPSRAATHVCRKCGKNFHVSHLRGLRLSGGSETLLFCPECDGPCEVLLGQPAEKKSFFDVLSQTIRLGVLGKSGARKTKRPRPDDSKETH